MTDRDPPPPAHPAGSWLARRRRSLLFLLLLPVLAGVASAYSLPVSLFPNIAFPRVRVHLDAGDRPAAQMALLVSRPVEEAVHRVEGVLRVQSRTGRGVAEITVDFGWGADMVAATLQINAAISQILSTLPPSTSFASEREDPTLFAITAYSLVSQTLPQTQLHDLAQYQLAPLLSSIPGVAHVDVIGGAEEEYQVLVDQARLRALNLTFDDVAKAVSAGAVLQAVGRLEDHNKLYLVVADSALTGPEQILRTVVRRGGDGVVEVEDIATVIRATAPRWLRVTADGREAVLFSVFQQRGGNTVQISQQVKARLDANRDKLPPGVALANWYDQSDLVAASAASVRDAILIGAALACLVLLVFLRNLKITAIALVVLPAVLAATVALLAALGMSFNIMTLGGMAAAVGLIIDDAIVMIEHIVRRSRAAAGDVKSTALAAAAEFTRPLAGSSAATLVIFIPLAFLSGVTGAFFSALSLTIAAALLISFLIAWLAVPLAARWALTDRDAAREDKGRFARRVDAGYRRVMTRLLARPLLVLLGLAPLILLGYLASQKVGSGFMPHMDEGGFIIDYRSAPGAALGETNRLLLQVEAMLRADPAVDAYSRRTGAGVGGDFNEPNSGDFFVRLKATGRPPIDDVMAALRARIDRETPGLQVEMAQLMEDLIGDLTGQPQPIVVKLFGDDAKTLLPAAERVAAAVAKIQGVVDVKNGVTPAGDSIDVAIDRTRAALAGVDPAQAAAAVGNFLQGQVAAYIATAIKQIGVRVWTPETARATDLDVAALTLRSPDGRIVTLRSIAKLTPVTGEPEIIRENLRRMVPVTARIEGRDLGSSVADVRAALTAPGLLPASVTYELGGLYEQQQIAFRGLAFVFAAALAAVFTLLLFLYENIRIAATILAMPLIAVAAVFAGLWLTGIELNITAMMGMTMIIGIVTEVAIFYFSEFEELAATRPLDQALTEAGLNRMRPIAMTTVAAILALLPLALALGKGSEMQQPLATAIISGLVVQLPLVLIAMPALFKLLGARARPRENGAAPSPTVRSP